MDTNKLIKANQNAIFAIAEQIKSEYGNFVFRNFEQYLLKNMMTLSPLMPEDQKSTMLFIFANVFRTNLMN